MKKLLLSLATVALVSSGAMADDLLYDLGFGSSVNVDLKYYPKNSNYTSDFTYTLTASETFTVSNFNNNGNGWTDIIKCGRKDYTSIGYITTDFAIQDNLTSVVLTIPTWTNSKVNSISLQSSSDGSTWTEIATHKATYDDSAAKTLTLSAPTPAANLYYRIAFDCQNGGNGLISLSNVKYYGTKSGVPSKSPAGISFASSLLYALKNTPVEAIALNNPNDLTVTYSSSAPAIVSVDETTGAIMAKAVGTAVISATSAETDEYAEGSASYTVEVVNKATNVSTLIQHSTAEGAKIGMAGYLTVTYVNGAYVYTKDYLDNPALIYAYDTTYKIGDMLNPTYFLEYSPFNGLPEWKFIGDKPEVSGTEEVYYTAYESVSKENLNEVCYINKVTFSEATPTAKNQNFTGTLADGSSLTFRTQWAVDQSVEAGTYNVFGAVGYYVGKDGVGTLQFYPISYEEAVTVEFPATITATSDATESFKCEFIPDEQSDYNMHELNITAETTADNVTIKLDVPEGWTNFIYSLLDADNGIGGQQLRAQAISWVNVSNFETNGYVLGNEFTVPADGETYQGQLFLVKDDKVDASDFILLTVTATKKEVPAEPVIPESISGTCDVQDAEIKSTTAETDADGVPSLYVTGTTDQEAATITLTVPEGWTGYLVYDAYNVSDDDSGIEPLADEGEESPWMPVSAMIEQGLTLTNAITVAVDGEKHEYPVYLVDGERVNMAAMFYVNATFTEGNANGVENIESSEADAVYYNLQGVQVANPANGVFVKVANGKAVKVVL